MENTRKSDVLAFCYNAKIDLYDYYNRLESTNFLTLKEQKNLVINQLKAINLLEFITNENEQNIAKINEIQTLLKKVDTVENIIQSTMYKITTAWK